MKKILKNVSMIFMILCISFVLPLSNDKISFASNQKDIWARINEFLSTNETPTGYSQNTFHPREEDFFGNNANTSPIFQVYVSPKDMTRNNKICITFDSAYINNYTYKILDILDAYEAKCTFFMTAEWALANPEHVREISRRGHEIGNHTVTHPNLNIYDENFIIAEILTCHNLIKKIIGVDMCLFRFPYGSYTPKTLNIIKTLGYYPIQWTFDSIDWKNESKDTEIRRFRYTNKLVPGAIVLCHNGATYTPECLPEILEYLKSKNIKCIKVSDMIYKHNFHMKGSMQIHHQDEYGNLVGDDIENQKK